MIYLPLAPFMPRGLESLGSGNFHIVKVQESSFPSGCEEYVRVIDRGYRYDFSDGIQISIRIQSARDIMRLFMATDAIRRAGCKKVHAYIPYLPYARQDRVCSSGESLSAAVMANMINAQGYESVTSIDPHSDVMPALINNYQSIGHSGHLISAMRDNADAVLCSPDAGAVKRVSSFAKGVLYSGDIIEASKKRVNGAIYTKPITDDLTGRSVIIVDDICDGGGTFIGLASKLKEAGAKKVILCVSHGLFTKGVEVLYEGGIDAIYTTNSYVMDGLNESLIKRSQL